MFGGFPGSLVLFAAVVSMVDFKFKFEGSPKKERAKMKIQFHLKCRRSGSRSLGVKGSRTA